MKTTILAALSFIVILNAPAQTTNSTVTANRPISGSANDTPYVVAERDANSRVWQRTTYAQDASGQTVTNVHQYTELATGMNYQKDNQWVESQDQIEVLA